MKSLTKIVLSLAGAFVGAAIYANAATADEIKVTKEQQAKYNAIQIGRFDDVTVEDDEENTIEADVISASLTDALVGNNDSNLTMDEGKKLFEQIEGNTFYMIVKGPKPNASMDEKNPCTNNPWDYTIIISEPKAIFSTKSGIEKKIKEIKDENFGYVRVEIPEDEKKPYKVTAYFENQGNGKFVERNVLDYEQNPLMAKLRMKTSIALADLIGNGDGTTSKKEKENLNKIIKESPDGFVWVQMVGGFMKAGEELYKLVEQYNKGEREAFDKLKKNYDPDIAGSTFESVTDGGVSRSSAGILKVDPKSNKILEVCNTHGEPRYTAK